jgi:hypothetical protein
MPIDLLQPCRDVADLKQWLKTHLNLHMPAAGICAGHCSPLEYIRRAYFEPAGDLVVWAPRGGGKTRLGAAATLLDLLHKPGCEVRILGGSLEQSFKMWEHLQADLYELSDHVNRHLKRACRAEMNNGSRVAVLTQSQRAVRGLRIQKLRCDEVELFDPDIWQAAQLTTRSKAGTDRSAPIAGVIEALSTWHVHGGLMQQIIDNARAIGTPVLQWCIVDVLQRCEPQRPCDGCPLWSECGGRAKQADGFIPIDDAIAMKRRVSIETWESEMLCRRPATRGAVFPSFDPDIHVKDRSPAGRFMLAIDFGFRAPFVCLWVCRCEDGSDYIVDEYIQNGVLLEDHLPMVESRPWPRTRLIACDPAGNGANDQTAVSNVQLLRSKGYILRFRASRIIDGLEHIRAALRPAAGQPRLSIQHRCKRLIAPFQSYHYGKFGGESPCKDGIHDHPIDALRYYYVNQVESTVKWSMY